MPACLPDCNNRTTTKTTGSMASILSQVKAYYNLSIFRAVNFHLQ